MLDLYTPRTVRALTLAALAATSVLSACDSNDIDTPITADVSLLVEPVVGSQAYSPTQTYTVNGRTTTFSASRLFISDLTLLRADGTTFRVLSDEPLTLPARDDAGATVQYTVDGTVHYAPLDLGEFEGHLGEVPAGDYTGLRFNVGLAGMANRVDATQAPTGSALEVRTDHGNWWSWNSGYIFAMNEGRVDLDGDGSVSGAADANWFIHLGTSAYVIPVTQSAPFTIAGGTEPALHLQVDLARLLQGIDLTDAAQRECMTMGCAATATAMKANLAAGVSFYGMHDHAR